MHKAGLACISCIISGVATHPIDTIKTKMQIQTPRPDGSKQYKNLVHGLVTLAKEEGVGRRGLYKGIEASALREGSYSTVRIGMYEPIKRVIGADAEDAPVWKKFASGALAGIIGSGLANPADLVKIRMQAQPPGEHNSLGWHTRNIYCQLGGIRGFYHGVGITMLRATVVGAVYMGSYDSIKHEITRRQLVKEGHQTQFAASFGAGFFITMANTPFDNMKTRIMS